MPDDVGQYESMRDAGADPRTVFLSAKAEGHDAIALIRILRRVFGLSLAEAKEVTVVGGGLAASSDQHQEMFVGPVRSYIEARRSLVTEMIRPHRCPDEGVPIPDLIGALNAVGAAEEVRDKRVLGASLHPNGMILIRTGGSIGGNLVALRRTEGGWEIADSTLWCS